MGEIRYENLKFLLSDTEKKNWMTDSFPHEYNNIETIVIFKRYREKERKPSKYAKARLEFIKVSVVWA